MNAKKLHTPEANKNTENILFTRVLACCMTSPNRTAKVMKLVSGIIDHRFKDYLLAGEITRCYPCNVNLCVNYGLKKVACQ
jgi:hypothetical protein